MGPRFVPRDDLLVELGCAIGDNGWVTVDPAGRPSIPGVWGIGNVVSEPAQMAPSIGVGMTAAIAVNGHLVADDLARALARRSPVQA